MGTRLSDIRLLLEVATDHHISVVSNEWETYPKQKPSNILDKRDKDASEYVKRLFSKLRARNREFPLLRRVPPSYEL